MQVYLTDDAAWMITAGKPSGLLESRVPLENRD
jgi:hypothetical protein